MTSSTRGAIDVGSGATRVTWRSEREKCSKFSTRCVSRRASWSMIATERRRREQVPQVRADRIAGGERRRVLGGRPIQLHAELVRDDERSHRIELHAGRQGPGQEGKLFRRTDEEGPQSLGIRIEADGGA